MAVKRKSKRKSGKDAVDEPVSPGKDQLIAMIVEKMKGVKPDPNYVPPPPPVLASPNSMPARKPLPEAPMAEDEFHNWRKRTLAELISMPTICPVRRCRRLRHCLIDEAICLERHRERAAQRVNLMLGWDACELFDEEDYD